MADVVVTIHGSWHDRDVLAHDACGHFVAIESEYVPAREIVPDRLLCATLAIQWRGGQRTYRSHECAVLAMMLAGV